jgi:nucleotide-binding universal stress UspA family protein
MKPAELSDFLDEGPLSQARPRLRRVLVALNGKDGPAEAAIAMGRLVAGALRKPLHGLFAAEAKVSAGDVPRLLDLPKDALDGFVLDVEEGDPAERIVAFTATNPTAFVVVGAESGHAEGLGVGELAAQMLARTTVPVLVARPRARAGLSRILVPLDGTPSTASALEPAGDLARSTGASLDIVLVGEAHHLPKAEPGAMAAPQYVDQPHHEWPAFSSEFVERFMKTLGHCPKDVPTRFFLGAGDPAEEILRFASALDSDLAVLVWHGRANSTRGAIFQRVLREAACPVLVLRC